MLRRAPRLANPVVAALGGIALMLLVGFVSGQDFNYDLINYHYSSAYLLLHGEIDRNVAPSGVQSWFNPIGYVPAYLAITDLPPRIASMLLAGAAGLNAPLIYLIAVRVAGDLPEADRMRIGFACTLIGMTGAITLAEAGTSFLDVELSIPTLGAVLAAIVALDARRPSRWLGIAGVLLGSICGLKLTCIVTAVGMAVALAILALRGRVSVRALAAFALGGALGFLLTGGWWAWRSWHVYGNPVFPMANDIFRSPLIPSRALNDTYFIPTRWTGLVSYPWHWLAGDAIRGTEIAIRDPRYAVGLLATLVGIGLAARRNGSHAPARGAGLLVASFLLATYIVWLFGFAILRYAVVLEMLSGVAMLAALAAAPRIAPRTLATTLMIAALVAVGWTRTGSWGRTYASADWFGIRGATALHRPGTVYVVPDESPLGFMVAAFPADARFVHIGGNLPLDPHTGLGLRAAAMLRGAPALRSLAAAPDDADGIAALRRFGLVAVPGSCARIATKVAPIESCVLRFVP
jgi:hypothetical protein